MCGRLFEYIGITVYEEYYNGTTVVMVDLFNQYYWIIGQHYE